MIRLKRNIFALLLSSANEYLYCVVSSSIYILIFFLEDQSYLLYFHQKAINIRQTFFPLFPQEKKPNRLHEKLQLQNIKYLPASQIW